MTDTQETVQYHLPVEGPQTDDELWWWMQAVWGIRIPRTRVCADHCSPFEAFADAYFARSNVAIWKASRGYGGKSKLLAALGMQEAVFLPAQVTILGGSGAQSLNVHAHMVEMWDAEHAPKQLLREPPTKYDTKLERKAWIRSLMASQTSVRGPHPQRLRMDEIDEMALDILQGAQGQAMRATKGPQIGIETHTVMSSTHQYPNGTMTEMLKEATLHEDWRVFQWCYRESMNPVDGWLDPSEVERKRSEIARHMWEAEYDLQEPSFEGRAFDTTAVHAAFDPGIGLTEEEDWASEWHERPDHPLYVTGVDWAKEKDRTIIATFDARDSNDWECVAWRAVSKQPWPYMVGLAEQRWREYMPVFAHDSTGLGDVIDDYLDSAMRRRHAKTFSAEIMGSGRARHDLFMDYIAAIEGGKIKYPRIKLAYDEHRYCISAGSMVLTIDGEIPIEQVEPGTLVATREGWRPALHRTEIGTKPVVTIEVNGRLLTLTADHRVAVPGGWAEAGTLTVGSLVSTVALTASPATAPGDDRVLLGEGVPTLAAGLTGLDGEGRVASQHVLSVGDRFEVLGPDARPVPTGVIEFESVRHRADPEAVGQDVGEPHAADVASRVPVLVGRLGPDPAPVDHLDPIEDVALRRRDGLVEPGRAGSASLGPVLNHGIAVETDPVGLHGGLGVVTRVVHDAHASALVYDIGVEGVHEFVAEGVVVHNCLVEDLFGTGHPPDSVVAGAIAWKQRGRGRRIAPIASGIEQNPGWRPT